MTTPPLIVQIISLPFDGVGAVLIIWTFIRLIKRHRRARQQRPTLWYAAWGGKLRYYAYVGDPKHEAKALRRLVKMLSAKKDNRQ